MKNITCECGCRLEASPSHCCEVRRTWQAEVDGTQFRRAGRAKWTVLKIHRADFENELGMMHAAEQFVRANLGRSWWRRLAVSATLFDLNLDIFRRTRGEEGARVEAWRSVRLFLAPAWPWLIKRLTLNKKDENSTP